MIQRINKNGITAIELALIVVILAILAVIAIPRFLDMSKNELKSAERDTVGYVRTRIAAYLAANKTYPPVLDRADDGPCVIQNPCFSMIIGPNVVTSGWTKSGLSYTGPAGGSYTYVPETGSF